jgi:hypothetical protein
MVSFKPHAYLLETETRPSSINIFGVRGGGERWLNIPLEVSHSVQAFAFVYAVQALAFVCKSRPCRREQTKSQCR